MIYREYLTLPGKIVVARGSVYRMSSHRQIQHHYKCNIHQPPHPTEKALDRSILGLFLVSKSITNEAKGLFFRHNDFHFDKLDYLEDFLNAISVSSRRSLASISFVYFGNSPARSIKALKECVGLRNLRIEIDLWSLGTLSYSSCWYEKDDLPGLAKMHGMGNLLKIRGIKDLEMVFHGDLDRYREDILPREAMKAALEVLKKPRKAAQLTRQERKDYPEPVGRTVFGKANVTTRGEKKMMGNAVN